MPELNWAYKYDFVCGLEVHIQLNTRSKVFSSDKNSFGEEPNSNVGIVTAGLPGSLPKLNEAVLEKAVLLGLACNATINRHAYFERKHYFYPDLPKGYQITQMKEPISIGGGLDIKIDERNKTIAFDHIHIEEDAGKSIHDMDEHHSYIDLNRAGTPLLELVTQPIFTHPEEVYAFLMELRSLVRALNISDGDMEKGSLRCDANVSLKPAGSSQLGNRTEIKNLNSMNFARKAVVAEAKRQSGILDRGGVVETQTMGYDVEGNFTFPLREKESSHDYRYFPDPDLPKVELTQEYIESIRKSMPELPGEKIRRLETDYGLNTYLSQIIAREAELMTYFEAAASHCSDTFSLANWLVGDVKGWLNDNDLSFDQFRITPKNMGALVSLISDGQLSKTLANSIVFPMMIDNPEQSPHEIMENHNLVTVDDEKEISSLAKEVFEDFPDKVEAYQKGKKGLVGFFIGEIMKRSGMKADPKKVADIARRMLD